MFLFLSTASFLSDHTLSIVIGSIVGILLCLLLISAFVYFEHRRVVLRRGTGLNARNQLLIKDEEIEMNKTGTPNYYCSIMKGKVNF